MAPGTLQQLNVTAETVQMDDLIWFGSQTVRVVRKPKLSNVQKAVSITAVPSHMPHEEASKLHMAFILSPNHPVVVHRAIA